MKSPSHRALSFRTNALAAAVLGFLVAAGPRVEAASAPTYGVRIYEVFQRGPKLDIEERTARAFAPNHVRNIALEQTWPAEDQPAIKVYKSRDHLGFFASYWREDGMPEYGRYQVELIDEGDAGEPGTALVRVRIVPREVQGVAATRRLAHPEHVQRRDERQGVIAPQAPTSRTLSNPAPAADTRKDERQAEKDAEKAKRDAEKAAREAERAAKDAEKDAEKAAKDAEKTAEPKSDDAAAEGEGSTRGRRRDRAPRERPKS